MISNILNNKIIKLKKYKIVIYLEQIHKNSSGGAAEFESRVLKGILNTIDNENLSKNIEFTIISKLSSRVFKKSYCPQMDINFKKFFFKKSNLNFIKNIISIFGNFEAEKIINDLNPDIVISLGPYKLKTDHPSICILWDLSHQDLPFHKEFRIEGELERRINRFELIKRNASLIIVGTDFFANKIKKLGVPSNKIFKIPMPYMAVNIKDKEMKSINLEKNSYIIYPANFWSHKNHYRLLEAFANFSEKNDDIKLVFTGFINRSKKLKFEEYINHLKIDKEKILHLGYLDKNEYQIIASNSIGLIFPSLLGPDNLPPIDFMSMNKPVAISKHEGHLEQTFNQCYYFNPYSIKEIEDALLWLISEEAKLNALNYKKEFLINPNRYGHELIKKSIENLVPEI